MAFDGIVMRAVALELEEALRGARIDKIYQPTKHELIFVLHRKGGASLKLLLSTLAQEARVHTVTQTPPNPTTPPLFCMVMRKHLEGGKIISITQQKLERVLEINCEVIDELGETALRQVIVEIMGKHSNILLLDPAQNKIIDAIHRVPASISRYRQVLPGLPYLLPPPQDKLEPGEIRQEDFYNRLLAQPLSTPLNKALLKIINGVSPQSVAEILCRSGLDPLQPLDYCGENELSTLWQQVTELGAMLKDGAFSPEVIVQDRQPVAFSALALSSYPAALRRSFASMNEALDYYYQHKNTASLLKQQKSNLESLVKKEIARCEKKAGLQSETILEAQKTDQYRLWGELLTAQLYQLSPGKEARVPNYYDPEGKIELIPLDEHLSIGENAQRYFTRYQKAKNAAIKAEKQLQETKEELTYLYSLISSLQSVTTSGEIAEILEEFREAGYPQTAGNKKSAALKGQGSDSKWKAHQPGKASKAGKTGKTSKAGRSEKQQTASLPQKITRDSWIIYVGKNNRQNDQLTMKMAKADDLWLHTKDIPGSHVVIKNPNHADIPAEILEEAAMLAAYHSQARNSAHVPVDYTLRKNVWKPKGAKPGFVLYDNQRTLYVTPEPDMITKMLDASKEEVSS
jgi:predicted ribosome quality control (RQC) complex YloA/Tae2 family protein